MEQVWRTPGVACPLHLAHWKDFNPGGRLNQFASLWFKKGRLLAPKKRRLKGKGFSFLSKMYGEAHRAGKNWVDTLRTDA